jgi:hypothetical protein
MFLFCAFVPICTSLLYGGKSNDNYKMAQEQKIYSNPDGRGFVSPLNFEQVYLEIA